MINKTFEVTRIVHEKALVEQSFSSTRGIILALAPEEMELVNTEESSKIDIDYNTTMH